jgi:hypothetical protein
VSGKALFDEGTLFWLVGTDDQACCGKIIIFGIEGVTWIVDIDAQIPQAGNCKRRNRTAIIAGKTETSGESPVRNASLRRERVEQFLSEPTPKVVPHTEEQHFVVRVHIDLLLGAM